MIRAKSSTEMNAQTVAAPISPDELRKIHAYWRAANYLSVGQIYLYDNPLLREPLIWRGPTASFIPTFLRTSKG
jgi:phosphoketolase